MNFNLVITCLLLLPCLGFILIALPNKLNLLNSHKAISQSNKIISILGLFISLFSAAYLIQYSAFSQSLFESEGLGLSLRLDAISLTMYGMIAIISYVIIRYSQNYLAGDPRQGVFFRRIAATIASVQLLVIAGNLLTLCVAWVLTSIFLHRLLVFYKERPRAKIAARKKFIVARIADICLITASYLLYSQFGTGDLATIFQQISNTGFSNIEAPAILLAVAAIFKSAQLPFHSWLLEVMETPTPVSALLHAGLLNAGPFLLIRMAFVIQESTYAPLLLVSIGGLTALIASIIYMTQNSIKTALAYSSMAHMGFSLMSCGLGVFSAAMLHLVAHSFYKAHSFLSSGSIIEKIKEQQFIVSEKLGSIWRTIFGIAAAFSIYIGCALLWGINPFEQTPLWAVGAVISLGTAHLFTALIQKKNATKLLLSAIGLSLLVNMSFFLLESSMHTLFSNELPTVGIPNLSLSLMASLVIGFYSIVIFIQMRAPFLKQNKHYNKLYIHLRNGLYMNIWFDKLVGANRIQLRPASNLQYIEKQQQESKFSANPARTEKSKAQYA